jgi:hypothetical protein
MIYCAKTIEDEKRKKMRKNANGGNGMEHRQPLNVLGALSLSTCLVRP